MGTAEPVERDVARGSGGAGRNRGSRRRWVMVVVALLLLVGGGWVIHRIHYATTHVSTDDAQVDGHIVPVLAKVGGYVASVPVEENRHVAAGAPLVLLDDADLEVRVAQARAALAVAAAGAGGDRTPGQASAELSAASSRRGALQAQLTAARVAAQRAESDLGRMRTLASKEIISQQQLEEAEAAAKTARANVEALERQGAAAGASITNAAAGVRMADAKLAAARAALDEALLNLSYAKVKAPVAGTVTKRQVEPGQLVQAGQPLMVVVADTPIWVTANVKETDLGDLRVGQPAEFDVDAYSGCVAEGAVESLSPATGAKFALLPPDNATGNFTKVVQRVPVRIRITKGCGAARPLRPGMSVVVHIATG